MWSQIIVSAFLCENDERDGGSFCGEFDHCMLSFRQQINVEEEEVRYLRCTVCNEIKQYTSSAPPPHFREEEYLKPSRRYYMRTVLYVYYMVLQQIFLAWYILSNLPVSNKQGGLHANSRRDVRTRARDRYADWKRKERGFYSFATKFRGFPRRNINASTQLAALSNFPSMAYICYTHVQGENGRMVP